MLSVFCEVEPIDHAGAEKCAERPRNLPSLRMREIHWQRIAALAPLL